ncbi:DDE-type integrase/transposase/recombinase [Denitrovibrio acetiphilus]|uniref:DDE-type integrase/transposase/recombinase n=1 Tax=Denitrovibrio acetiphilus TaxID=118000 RepID=UPI0006919603|nr:DDE-type integrase/transposase/recombinase [Denitrovibrio acetiphilus]
MHDILDILRRRKHGDGFKTIAKARKMSRNTIRKYIELAVTLGFESDSEPPLEEIAYGVYRKVYGDGSRPVSECRKVLIPYKEKLEHWLSEERLTMTKIHSLLKRHGVSVSYDTLRRYLHEDLGFFKHNTVRMPETAPGEYAEVDFGRLGLLYDPETDRRRVVHALIVTLPYSRYQYVHLCHSMKFQEVITGLESAWEFFGGVPAKVIVDNMKTAIDKADRYDAQFNRYFYEYACYRGFIIDPARAVLRKTSLKLKEMYHMSEITSLKERHSGAFPMHRKQQMPGAELSPACVYMAQLKSIPALYLIWKSRRICSLWNRSVTMYLSGEPAKCIQTIISVFKALFILSPLYT